jgi:hypothetical protein
MEVYYFRQQHYCLPFFVLETHCSNQDLSGDVVDVTITFAVFKEKYFRCSAEVFLVKNKRFDCQHSLA